MKKLLWLVLAILIIGAAAFAYRVSNTDDVDLGDLQKKLDPEPERPAIDPELGAKTADWKVYKSAKYGFEFKYPPSYTLKQEREQANQLLSLGTQNIHIAVVRKSDYKYNDLNCGRYRYDSKLNAWLRENTCDAELKNTFEPICPNKTIGTAEHPALELLWGDAGYSRESSFLVTDKDHIVIFSISRDETTTEDVLQLADLARQTFTLYEGTRSVSPVCSWSDLALSIDPLPDFASPASGDTLSIGSAPTITLTSNLPSDAGVFIYLSSDHTDLTHPLPLGELHPGALQTVLPRLSDTDMHKQNLLHGDYWLHARFYKILGGKKIFGSSQERQIVKVRVENDLPSALEVSIDPIVASKYPTKNGRVVLQNGSFNEGILAVRAVNVKDCSMVSLATNQGTPALFGIPQITTLSVYVDPSFPKDALVTTTFSCKTPKGETLSKTIEFWNN